MPKATVRVTWAYILICAEEDRPSSNASSSLYTRSGEGAAFTLSRENVLCEGSTVDRYICERLSFATPRSVGCDCTVSLFVVVVASYHSSII